MSSQPTGQPDPAIYHGVVVESPELNDPIAQHIRAGRNDHLLVYALLFAFMGIIAAWYKNGDLLGAAFTGIGCSVGVFYYRKYDLAGTAAAEEEEEKDEG